MFHANLIFRIRIVRNIYYVQFNLILLQGLYILKYYTIGFKYNISFDLCIMLKNVRI